MGEKEQAGIRKSSGSRDSDFASLQNCTRVGYIVGASKEQSKIQLKCETSFNFPTTVYENRQDHELQDYDAGTHPKSWSDISGRWTVEEQSEGFALKNFVHLPPSEEEVVKQTQPQEQDCGLNISATKNPGM